MRIPNFRTEEGSILYKNTVGRLISPRVADNLLNHVQAHIASGQIRSILDLGCGPGTVSLALAAAHPQMAITAADASESMLSMASNEAASRGVTNIRFASLEAGHIRLDADAFDLVLCNLAFPFFAKPFDSMREVYAVVRPGGTASFTVPGRGTWDEFFAVAESVLGDAIAMARPFLAKFTQAEVLPDAMSAAGFTDIVEERHRLPFRFECGLDVLAFFGELFHLLDYATADMKSELAEAIDHQYPTGFTMHYEAVLLSAARPVSSVLHTESR